MLPGRLRAASAAASAVQARLRAALAAPPAMRARPLATLAAGFVAGIAAWRHLEAWVPLLILAAACALLIIRSRHPALIALLGVALGGLRQEWSETRAPIPLSDVVEGTVDGPPRVYRSLGDAGDAPPVTDGSFVVGRVQVRWFHKPVPLIGGERVRVRGVMRRPGRATNPGQFDYGDYLERRGIDAVMTLQRGESLEILEGPPALSRLRGRVRGLFDRGMAPDVAAFEGAIVLGRREAVADSLVRDLQRSGTAHLLAISGQNLVIVMVSLWVVLTLLGLRGRALSLLLLSLLGFYVLLVGPEVSVLRSYLMMAAFFGADLAWRRRDAPTSLGAAAIVLCAADPNQVVDVGFQLSFAAVLGLSMLAPIFHSFTGAGGWMWNRLRTALGVSVAAWLATAPIVLWNFNLLTPVIVLANLVLVPLMTVEFILGLAHLALAPLGLGLVTGAPAGLVFAAIGLVSRLITAVPCSYLYAPPPPGWLMAAYYAGLAAWTLWCRRGPPRGWKAASVVLLVLPLGLSGPLRHRAPEGVLLAVLDVGRGSCAYLEWPDGRNLMVDCGSLDALDPGASIAAKYLWNRGVTRVDTLVLSHTDADHVNGARSIIDLMNVRRVVVPPAFRGWEWPPGVEVEEFEREDRPEHRGLVELLGPPVWEKFGHDVAPNETSIVLRAGGVLLPGDVEERGVDELFTLEDLRAEVLVMPYHGKFFRQHEEFVRRVAPRTIIVSAPEGYFSPRVIDALPVKPRLTGREGAIEIVLPLR